jgi:predicted  nucleic acid-binding Zn-ribbon protein
MTEELKACSYHIHCMNCGWEIESPEIDALQKSLKVTIDERDALRMQLESVKVELKGFKSGTKEGAEIMRAELKRIKYERDALRKQLEVAMEALGDLKDISPDRINFALAEIERIGKEINNV